MPQTKLPLVTDEGRTIAGFIDHTLLKPDATETEILCICEEARLYRFAGVCVNGTHIVVTAKALKGSGVLPVCVIGFPLGAMLTASKADETRRVVEAGAEEVDMVLNIGALKENNLALARNDIAAVVEAAGKKPVKVILECCLLTNDEKITACKLSVEAGAAFVKTSTGFSKSGATLDDVKLMRQTVGPKMGVKAAGGVRDLATARAMIEAGATRLGTSSGVTIVTGGEAKSTY